MVDQSAFQTQGSEARQPSTYFVKDKNGVVSEVEIGRDQIKPPPSNFYRLRLKGLSAPFSVDGQFGPGKCVRALMVVRTPGPNKDRMFSQLLTIAKPNKRGEWRSNITPKSGPGQMIGVIRGKPIVEGEPINLLDFLNGDFEAMVNQTTEQTDNGLEIKAAVVKDTWKAVDDESASPEPEMAAVGAVASSGNPFMDDDD